MQAFKVLTYFFLKHQIHDITLILHITLHLTVGDESHVFFRAMTDDASRIDNLLYKNVNLHLV